MSSYILYYRELLIWWKEVYGNEDDSEFNRLSALLIRVHDNS